MNEQTVTFEITCWDNRLAVKVPGIKSPVVPMRYAAKFKKLYPIARNLVCRAWLRGCGNLQCEFTASPDEIEAFKKEHEHEFPFLPIEDNIEAVRFNICKSWWRTDEKRHLQNQSNFPAI